MAPIPLKCVKITLFILAFMGLHGEIIKKFRFYLELFIWK